MLEYEPLKSNDLGHHTKGALIQAPKPRRPCQVIIENKTELSVTAVCIKWVLTNRLPTGGISTTEMCPTSEPIEFQFSETETQIADMQRSEAAVGNATMDGEKWTSPKLDLKPLESYYITIMGSSSSPEFDVRKISPIV